MGTIKHWEHTYATERPDHIWPEEPRHSCRKACVEQYNVSFQVALQKFDRIISKGPRQVNDGIDVLKCFQNTLCVLPTPRPERGVKP